MHIFPRWLACLVVLFLGLLSKGFANADLRNWILQSGTVIRAELLDFDEKTRKVRLRLGDQREVEYSESELSALDRAWILEWTEFAEELEALQAKLGGKVVHLQSSGKYPTDLYVYTPSRAVAGQPVLMLFDAGGKALRYLKRHMEAAEAVNLTLVALGTFRNSSGDEAGLLERFKELLPGVEKAVSHDPKRLFLGGTSGGALRAYHYSAKVQRPWAGIYANGGWLGGHEYTRLPYPGGMRVAMVNGDKDEAANHWIESDGKVLEAAGNDVAVMAFEGGHQVPPVSVQIKAFRWLLRQQE